MNRSNRSNVLVVGELLLEKGRVSEQAAAPFIERYLTPVPIKLEQLSDASLHNDARGILLAYPHGKYREIESYFSDHFSKICRRGLMTAVLVTTVKDIDQLALTMEVAYKQLKIDLKTSKLDLAEFHKRWVFRGETNSAIAETIARFEAGPKLGTAKIEFEDEGQPLDFETITFLKRAFQDCTSLRVERQSGGKAAKDTLQVFAKLDGPEFGPQPMPFFVKIGEPRDIEDEKENYRDRAEPFIPFYLRPALNQLRSVSGLTASALVCNYVDHAVPLRDALRDDHGTGTIFSLFEVTLRGLRMHTLNTREGDGFIEQFIDDNVKTEKLEQQWRSRIEIARDFGLKNSPTQLKKILRTYAGRLKTRQGIYHRDLHAGNVMVRNRDAIVIDFGTMRDFGPLSADPAVLEVGLAFGTDCRDKPKLFKTWRSFIDDIFLNNHPLSPPLQTGAHFPFAWLEKAIRELRHVVSCCGVKSEEGLIVLCACLLRFASHSPRVFPKKPELDKLSEERRAYAVVVAERIFDKYIK